MITLYHYDPVFITVQRTTYRQMNVSQIADASAVKDVKQYQGDTRTIRHCGWHTKTVAAAASLSPFVHPPLTKSTIIARFVFNTVHRKMSDDNKNLDLQAFMAKLLPGRMEGSRYISPDLEYWSEENRPYRELRRQYLKVRGRTEST